MALLSRKSLAAIEAYDKDRPRVEIWAKAAADALKVSLADSNIPNEVLYRAKTTASLRAKLRDRRVGQPKRLFYDTIGCRVVTYYDEDVDRVVEHLGQDLDLRKVSDRRKRLRIKTFGYRSVHLIARLRDQRCGIDAFALLGTRRFEVQVRSVLEHAWAEIEHEVVYKGGTEYPTEVVRRFASVAGSLEVLGREFSGLRDEWDALVESYQSRYTAGLDAKVTLDAARLVALLEVRYPRGIGWRQALRSGEPFEAHSDHLAVDALAAAGCRTAAQLDAAFKSTGFKRYVARYSIATGQARDELSHLTIVSLAVVSERRAAFEEYFPDASADPFLQRALDRGRAGRD